MTAKPIGKSDKTQQNQRPKANKHIKTAEEIRRETNKLIDEEFKRFGEIHMQETLKAIAEADPHPTNPRYLQYINEMESDEQKIIEHNKHNYNGRYYGIVDKQTCQLKIYRKNGKLVKTYTVGIGRKVGDAPSAYFRDKKKSYAKAQQKAYTTAGEFTMDEITKTSEEYIGSDGKPKIIYLKGDNRGERSGQLAIHMIYKPEFESRNAAIESPDLKDNRMSYGCINLKEEEYDEMHKKLGEGDKIYVLPEEKGNKLQLEKQTNGTYKFAQLYHKDVKRDLSPERASKVKYDIRPDRDPNKMSSFDLLNPSTWFD